MTTTPASHLPRLGPQQGQDPPARPNSALAKYQDPRSAEWAAKSTVAPERLGRCFDYEGAVAKWGEAAVRPLVEGYLTSDDLGRAVVEDLAALGPAGKGMLDAALNEGVDSVEGAPESLVTLFKTLDNPPDWVDWDQLRRGSIAYFRAGPLVSFGLTCAVIGGSQRAYGITRPIVYTGRFDKLAFIRAKETTRWIVAAVRPDGMRRDAEGFKLSVHVRMLHAMTRRMISRAEQWDWDDWGLPMADTDGLYAISYDFTEAMVDAMKNIGVRFSDAEVEDIYALWRFIGWVMGVPEHLLHRNQAEGRRFAAMYLALDPGADDECRTLLKSLIELATPEESDESLDVFPKFVTAMFPPLRLRKMLYGFTRYWAGDEVADQLGVPDTPYKHLPRVIRPAIALNEATRRFRKADDEKACYSTLRILEMASLAGKGESTLAPTDECMDSIKAAGPSFAGSRGRRSGAARG